MKTNFQKPYIVGIGGANIDIHAKLNAKAIAADSNPAKIYTSPGGVTRNILDNLSREGNSCVLLSSIGSDAFGKLLLDNCEKLGIDVSRVLVRNDYSTGSYMSIIDSDGSLSIAACDARVVENIPLSYFDDNRDIISSASAVVCDPNLETNQLIKIAEVAGSAKLFIDPVSTTKALKIKDILDRFYCIKPNRMELEILSGIRCDTDENIKSAADKLLSCGVFSVVVSLEDKGCYYADRDGNSLFRSLNSKFDVVNTTGAGDAFMSGIVSSYVKEFDLKTRLDYALSCGAIAILSKETINPEMSEEYISKFIEQYRRD